MGYRKIEPVLVNIFNLCQYCGLFKSIELNGGYGCQSRSKDKCEVGLCYDFDCPLAYEAGLEDMKEHDVDLYNEYKEECDKKGMEPHDIGSDWVIQWREVV